MQASHYSYHHNDLECHGYLALDDRIDEPRPAVLVVHDWSGRNEFACQKAQMLAKLGYVGFALDMYGLNRTGQTAEEKSALMQPLMADRALLRARILAAYDAVKAMDEVDASHIAVMGFCFGGLCALDLARSGVALAGAISFHGLLKAPQDVSQHPIQAKILALHGYDDPMVRPAEVEAFAQEMNLAQVDWQVHMYGRVQHAFTNPLAHDPEAGLRYDPVAEGRAMQSMINFLDECFNPKNFLSVDGVVTQ